MTHAVPTRRSSDRLTPAIAAPATSAQRFSRTDDLVNWQAGLVFKPTPNTSIYASYATSATPPNSLIGEGSESNGLTPGRSEPASTMIDDLKVEKTKSSEICATADLFDDHLSPPFAAFPTYTKKPRANGSEGPVGMGRASWRDRGGEYGNKTM